MLLKGFRNYIRPHTDIYRSDLSLGDGSRPTESDLATRQTPSEWPLCEKADWFSLLSFLHPFSIIIFIHHFFQEQSLAAAAPHSSVNRLAPGARLWITALELAGLRLQRGKCRLWSADEKTLKHSLSHRHSYYNINYHLTVYKEVLLFYKDIQERHAIPVQ